MDDKYFKSFQDLKPIVLTKSKNNMTSNTASNTSFHISKIVDTDDITPIIYYTQQQIDIIRGGRNALKLTQVELTKKINSSLPNDFIAKIENGTSKFDAKTYKTILRTLNIKK